MCFLWCLLYLLHTPGDFNSLIVLISSSSDFLAILQFPFSLSVRNYAPLWCRTLVRMKSQYSISNPKRVVIDNSNISITITFILTLHFLSNYRKIFFDVHILEPCNHQYARKFTYRLIRIVVFIIYHTYGI